MAQKKTQKTSIAGLGPGSVVGRKGKSWGEKEKKKTKQKSGKQSDPSGELGRRKGPSPPHTRLQLGSVRSPVLLASPPPLQSLYALSKYNATCRSDIPHKQFKAIHKLCGCRVYAHPQYLQQGFASDDGDSNEKVKTITLHVHESHKVLHFSRHCTITTWKCIINFSFPRGRKQARMKFSFSS